MDRSIKFRFWRDGRMQFATQLNAYVNTDNEFQGDGEVLMQYTGIQDENGVDIYEGDIVIPVKFDDNIPNVITYVSHGFYRVKKHGERVYCNMLGSCNIKVIGNIFENADLLNINQNQ